MSTPNHSDVFITYAKRTPMGKIAGALAAVRPDDLLAYLFKHFKDECQFDLNQIDDVIVGCSNQAGEDNRNIARMSLLLAGLPFEVPATTINRLCASSLDATLDAYARIKSGMADCILVGGVESMSRAPYVMSKPACAYDRNQKLYDSSFGWRFPNPKMQEIFPLYGMGETAEEISKEHTISRQEQDAFALASHQKAISAISAGHFKQEILPITFTQGKQTISVDTDECPRQDTSLEQLAKLRAVFRKDGTVTAGNSSPMNDGASALCLVSETFLKKHNLSPLLRVMGGAARGLHPNIMGLGPVYSTQRLCQRYKLKVSDFDVVELNEAFAIQSLACLRELQIPEQKVNLWGGAIALGHPLGCSGARLVCTLSSIMQKNKKLKKGLASMCVGVGQGVSVAFENC